MLIKIGGVSTYQMSICLLPHLHLPPHAVKKHYLVKDLDAGHLVLGTGYLPYILVTGHLPGTAFWVLGIECSEYLILVIEHIHGTGHFLETYLVLDMHRVFGTNMVLGTGQ